MMIKFFLECFLAFGGLIALFGLYLIATNDKDK